MAVSDLSVPGRTLVMGIVNVTEDSFSDVDPAPAVGCAGRAQPTVELPAHTIRRGIFTQRLLRAPDSLQIGGKLPTW